MDVIQTPEREIIIQQLRDYGCRITKQRLTILDIILNGDPSCVKEIYREAVKKDRNIGSATVYRMINTLEEIGVINRKNMYQVDCRNCDHRCENEECENECIGDCEECESKVVITLDDNSRIVVDRGELQDLIYEGLKATGKLDANKKILRMAM